MSDAAIAIREPNSHVALLDQCASIEAWADRCDSVPQLQDANNKLAAIDEYVALTSIEGRARIATTRRRIEVRIGHLLGPAPGHGPGRGKVDHDQPLSSEQRHAFRQMAEHEDLVEDVIADSTDEQPASRRKVMDAIKRRHPVQRRSSQDVAAAIAKVIDLTRAARELADSLTDSQLRWHEAHQLANWAGALAQNAAGVNELVSRLTEAKRQ